MELITVVQTVGFPIAAFVWATKEIRQMRKEHTYETKRIIERNTEAFVENSKAVMALSMAVATCPQKQ